MKKIQAKEQGQILVLLILVFIGIIAFAALAMDGGMIFSDRRYSQNAADAASLAGATKAGEYFNNYVSGMGEPILNSNFTCDGAYIPQAKNTALDESVASAVQNKFSIAKGDTSAESHVEVTCVDNGSDAPPYDKYLAVKVQITNQTTSNFAHLFYPGPLKGTVEAVTKLYPGFNVGMGQGLLATCNNIKDATKEGIIISGTAKAIIKNAGAFSNCSIIANGGGTIDAEGGSINYVVGYDGPLENFDPDPSQVTDTYSAPPSSSIVTSADCINYSNPAKDPGVKNKESVTINPGTYKSISQSGGVLTLNPGLYCITEKGGFVTTGGATIGDGVTIFMLDGGIKIAGNTGVNKDGVESTTSLRAPYIDTDRDLRWYGYLIVMDDGNAPDNNPLKYSVDITGTTETDFVGTIYAPNHNVKLTGDSTTETDEVTFSTQVIGNTITLAGTPIISVQYNSEYAPYFEPSLDLHK
ncbi:MAG: pilus assembly protein TadG-related protein [Anaerolineaceae bacterium]